MTEIDRQVHGVPLWLMRDYLVDLGGVPQEEGFVVGEGWEATYQRVEDFRLGSLVIGVVHLRITGEEGALAKLMWDLELKLLRGGG